MNPETESVGYQHASGQQPFKAIVDYPLTDESSISDSESESSEPANFEDLMEMDDNNSDDDLGIVSAEKDIIPRTKNEVEDLGPVEPVNINIPENERMEEIGYVKGVSANKTIIIQGFGVHGTKVPKEDTIILFQDRQILGRIFEIFGQVSSPLYSIRFNNLEDVDQQRIETHQKVFFLPNYSELIDTRELKTLKGSDASNMYDEEVGIHEMEFSDDEKELEFRNQQNPKKGKKRQRKPQGTDKVASDPYHVLARPEHRPCTYVDFDQPVQQFINPTQVPSFQPNYD